MKKKNYFLYVCVCIIYFFFFIINFKNYDTLKRAKNAIPNLLLLFSLKCISEFSLNKRNGLFISYFIVLSI